MIKSVTSSHDHFTVSKIIIVPIYSNWFPVWMITGEPSSCNCFPESMINGAPIPVDWFLVAGDYQYQEVQHGLSDICEQDTM